MNWAHDIVRVLSGAVLLAAAGLKAHVLATEPTAEASLATSRWFLVLWVEVELLCGLALLCSANRRFTTALGVGCFGILAVVSALEAVAGDGNCGCFGKLSVHIQARTVFLFDVGALTAIFVSARLADDGASQRAASAETAPAARTRLATILALWLALGVPTAIWTGTFVPATVGADGTLLGDSEAVLLEPQSWVGARLPLSAHLDPPAPVAEGTWLVVLYSQDCSHCREFFSACAHRLPRLAQRYGARQLAFVEVRSHGDQGLPSNAAAADIVAANLSHWRDPIVQGLTCQFSRLPGDRRWFGSTPTAILLEEGVVRRVTHDL